MKRKIAIGNYEIVFEVQDGSYMNTRLLQWYNSCNFRLHRTFPLSPEDFQTLQDISTGMHDDTSALAILGQYVKTHTHEK